MKNLLKSAAISLPARLRRRKRRLWRSGSQRPETDSNPTRRQDMENSDRALVLERLRELEGWAEYITEALHLNQRLEPVKREMLERALDPQALKQLREMSWSLRDKLHMIGTEVELSCAEAPVAQVAQP